MDDSELKDECFPLTEDCSYKETANDEAEVQVEDDLIDDDEDLDEELDGEDLLDSDTNPDEEIQKEEGEVQEEG